MDVSIFRGQEDEEEAKKQQPSWVGEKQKETTVSEPTEGSLSEILPSIKCSEMRTGMNLDFPAWRPPASMTRSASVQYRDKA